MNRLKTKLVAGAGSLLMLGSLAVPAFASSTVSISSASSSNPISFDSFGNNFPFGDFKFDQFFSQLFDRSLEAQMDGSEEVPGPGDPDGIGEAEVRIKPSENKICVDIKTKYIDTATAAHIHHAPTGSSGAVVVPLAIPDSAGESHGCVDIDNNLIKAIKVSPQDYYVNVHTNTYPEGAIRGQLSK